jgi:hypothetical protein
MPQPPQTKDQCMQQLSHPLPTVLDVNAGIDEVADQFGPPQTHVIAQRSGTLAHRLFDL